MKPPLSCQGSQLDTTDTEPMAEVFKFDTGLVLIKLLMRITSLPSVMTVFGYLQQKCLRR